MKDKVKIESKESPRFELVLQVRDNNGKPTGKTKSFVTDDAAELEEYFQRNSGVKKKRRKKKKVEKQDQDKQPE